MEITRRSPFTKRVSTKDIPVTEAQMALWHSGMSIQFAMPNLSADDREFIKTGITPEDWATLDARDDGFD